MTTQPRLARRLGLADAVFIGLGSMIGAGVFVAFIPAAQAAGTGLLLGLVVAAVVAFCNATSSAQLAATYPLSGGTYLYGRRQLGAWWGFIAGWNFVIGKVASCAAMALTFAAYAAPAGWQPGDLLAHGWYGILQSAGLLFFAFAGYARIATMGEEVRNPARTIPLAITIALGITVVVYAIVAVTMLRTLGASGIAASSAPLADVVAAGGWDWAAPIVRVGAAAASLGALLGLIAGIGRTSLAMAREGDLPRWLAAVHPRFAVPHRAEVALAIVVCLLVLTVDLRGAIGFSSFGVLVYYFIANVAAFTQGPERRRYPRAVQAAGVAFCLVLILTLPLPSILVGVGVVAVGVLYRLLVVRPRSRPQT